MNDRVKQFRIGVVAVMVVIITIVLVIVFTDPFAAFQERYVFDILFDSAPGVSIDSPVKKSGVLIGRVQAVELQKDGKVRVTVAVDAKYDLRKNNEIARIGGGSLLGDAVISFVPSGKQIPDDELIQAGDTVIGTTVDSPLDVVADLQESLNALVGSVTTTSNDIDKLVTELQDMLQTNKGQVNRLLDKSEQTLDSVGTAAKDLSGLMGDPQLRANLNRTLEEFPKVLAEARQATTNIRQTLDLADRNLRNLERFTEPLAERGGDVLTNADELFGKLGRSADKLDRLMENMVIFTEGLNRQDGTLARLMNDPTLADNLIEATDNLNRAMIEVRPILQDARTFTDKIARHPELLGARGVIQGSDGAKPVNSSADNFRYRREGE